MIKQNNANWVKRNYFSNKEKTSFSKIDSCCIKLIDKDSATAVFSGSKDYQTSLLGCSCPDYSKVGFPVPCKHMFRLAKELGFFSDNQSLKGNEEIPFDSLSDLYSKGELLPSQFCYYFDSDKKEWLFGLKSPIGVKVRGHKSPVYMYACFSLDDPKSPLFYLKAEDRTIDLGEDILEFLPNTREGLFISISMSFDERNFHLNHNEIEGEVLGSSEICFALFDEEFLGKFELRKMPSASHSSATYSTVNIGPDYQVILKSEVSTEQYTREQQTEDLFIEFSFPRVFFFKPAYVYTLSEIKGNTHNKEFKSNLFDHVII